MGKLDYDLLLEQPVVFQADVCQVVEGGEVLQGAREHPGSKYLVFQGKAALNWGEANRQQ